MRLSDICGQDAIVSSLRQAVHNDKLAHAYLFSGPTGVGKRSTAMALATALNCQGSTADACETCGSCKKIARESHPDLLTVTCPEKKTRIPIEAIRDLDKRLKTRPHEGKVRVAIIIEADLMTESAANAILKTLEEPAPGNLLILTTSRLQSLLPTVRSRCQLVRFRPLPKEVVSALLQRNGVSAQDAAGAATLAGGSMKLAQECLGSDLDARLNLAFDFLAACIDRTPEEGLRIAASFSKERALTTTHLDTILFLVSELLWIHTHRDSSNHLPLPQALATKLSVLAMKMNATHLADCALAASKASRAVVYNNMSPQLALEGMLMTIRRRGEPSPFGNGFGVI